MRPQDSPFKKLSRDEKQQQAQKRELIQENADALIARAKELLSNKDFVDYRTKYKRLEETIITTLIYYTAADPMQYAFTVRGLLGDLKILRELITKPIAKAREK